MASRVSNYVAVSSQGSRARDSRERHSLLRGPTRDHEETEPLLASNIQDHVQDALTHSVNNESSSLLCLDSLRRRISWQKFCYSRIPRGKAVFLVLVISTIETFAFYGAVDGIIRLVLGKNPSTTSLASIVLQYSAGRLCYPLTGFLADVYFGRYKVINISLWLFWIAFGSLALAFSLSNHPHVPQELTQYPLPIAAFALITIGSAGIEANILPFGVDQFPQEATSQQISSYFYWWYVTKQLGSLLGVGAFIGIFLPSYLSLPHSPKAMDFELNVVSTIQTILAVLVTTVGILLHACCNGWYFKSRERKNPIKLVLKVLIFAAFVKRQPPRYRRAFRYGETPKPRIELAKKNYDGIYTSEEVEDVKTFCRIVLVIFSLTGYFASYSAVSSIYRQNFMLLLRMYDFFLQAYVMLSYQLSNLVGMITRPTNMKYSEFVFPTLYTIFDAVSALIYLPLINHLVLPCFPSLSMRKRLGIGSLVNIITLISAAYVQWGTGASDSKHVLLWLLIPGALLPLGEVLMFVTGK